MPAGIPIRSPISTLSAASSSVIGRRSTIIVVTVEPGAGRLTEVALDGEAQPLDVLHQDRLVETVLLARLLERNRVTLLARERERRDRLGRARIPANTRMLERKRTISAAPTRRRMKPVNVRFLLDALSSPILLR